MAFKDDLLCAEPDAAPYLCCKQPLAAGALKAEQGRTVQVEGKVAASEKARGFFPVHSFIFISKMGEKLFLALARVQ